MTRTITVYQVQEFGAGVYRVSICGEYLTLADAQAAATKLERTYCPTNKTYRTEIYQVERETTMETNEYHLVTITVTYRVEEAGSNDDAIDIAAQCILPSTNLDGVVLEDYRDLFCSHVSETENGIECMSITEEGK